MESAHALRRQVSEEANSIQQYRQVSSNLNHSTQQAAKACQRKEIRKGGGGGLETVKGYQQMKRRKELGV